MANFIATYETGRQITEDSFTVVNPSLSITEDTTIREIKEWFSDKEGTSLLRIKVIELEELPKSFG